ADSVKICKAKKLKGDFGLKFSLFSSVLGLLISAAFFILLIIDLSYLQAFLNGALSQLSFKSPFPFYHINTGFLNVEGMLLALILFFLSKAIYSRSLAKTLRRNVPKSLALWVCAVLQLLAFIVFIQDGLDRMQIIPSHYKYCGTEANNLFIMYYSSVVCLIATIAVLLLFIKTFITIHKMRKIRNAF
ncbi:MAG: hypothetical protein J6Q67_02860, partial [Clostridia bacterium]|nr:hypothetical protein [Clostridia bacterium]